MATSPLPSSAPVATAATAASSSEAAPKMPPSSSSSIVPAPDAATMPGTDDALARVQAFSADAYRTLSDATHTLADQAGRLTDDGQQFVREHPASTLGSAFALGIALGVLVGVRP